MAVQGGHSDGGKCAAQGDAKEDLPRRAVQEGLFFQFGFHQGQSDADDEHHPGHGRHGVDQMAPRQPSSQAKEE